MVSVGRGHLPAWGAPVRARAGRSQRETMILRARTDRLGGTLRFGRRRNTELIK